MPEGSGYLLADEDEGGVGVFQLPSSPSHPHGLTVPPTVPTGWNR